MKPGAGVGAGAETAKSSYPAAVGPARCDAELAELMDAFESATISRSEWTHRAHLSMALVYLLRYGQELGPARIRAGILHFNAALNIEQTPTGGYHETITRFYIWVVGRFLASADVTKPRFELANELFEQWGDRSLPLQYYSKERISSWEARTGWVAPDLRPLN
jgi:hypothetical protein